MKEEGIEKPSTDLTELGSGSLIKAEALIVVSKCLVGNTFLLNSMNITTTKIGI